LFDVVVGWSVVLYCKEASEVDVEKMDGKRRGMEMGDSIYTRY